ncbi:MAG TPA: GGDEF domain-containing protein [Burkholderiales bacterium]|nr:GGDEF domain-containing protein [Burkholderiales bacterium]
MDIRTLFVAVAVSNLAFALGIFLYVKGQHSVHHSIAIWGKSRFFGGLGVALLAMRGEVLPVPMVIVAANSLLFTAVMLSVIAFKSCLDRPIPRMPSLATTFLGFALLWLALLAIGIPENIRLVMFTFYFSFAMIIISRDLAMGWRDSSILQKFMATITPAFAVLTFIRGVVALFHPAEGLFSSSTSQVAAMFTGFVETISTSFGFLLLAKEKTDRELEAQAGTDHLTGLSNRRSFYAMAEKLFSLEKRMGNPVSLLLLDIDHFKKINDRYGHDAGDRILVEFAAILRSATRQCDFLVRLGGEEFGVLMPDTPPCSACDAAERIRLAVESCAVEINRELICFTVSIGVYGEESASSQNMDHYFRSADAALYRAKELGRNRVESEVPENRDEPNYRLAAETRD